jgi:hypothetical protein
LETTGLHWLSHDPPPRPMLIAESCSYPAFLHRLHG